MLHIKTKLKDYPLSILTEEWLRINKEFSLYDGQKNVGLIVINSNLTITSEIYQHTYKPIVQSILNDINGMLSSLITSGKTLMNKHELFLNKHDSVTQIPFKEDWKNGTGYFDYACTDESLNLAKGQFVGSVDNINRKMLIVGVGEGYNVVIFERMSDGYQGVICSNSPHPKHGIGLDLDLGSTSLSLEHVENFLNYK